METRLGWIIHATIKEVCRVQGQGLRWLLARNGSLAAARLQCSPPFQPLDLAAPRLVRRRPGILGSSRLIALAILVRLL